MNVWVLVYLTHFKGLNVKVRSKNYYVYILTNKKNEVFYVGVTNSVIIRTYQHKIKQQQSFTKKYNLNKLVYFEEYTDIKEAISREKTLKKWQRDWKIQLIEKHNPSWNDLYEQSDFLLKS